MLDKDFPVTKQAYHEARQKIKPEIFIEMNNHLCHMAYQEAENGYEKWNGYRLSAIDGSVLQLPDTKKLREALEIENFTGTNKVAIEQDFYASIYVSNMIELVRAQKNDNIKEKNKTKGLKYEYKTNLSILTGVFKDKFVCMFLEDSPRKRKKIFDSIMKQISKCVIPIRPGRRNERKPCTTRGKFKTNFKRCL